jgi:hypothetical protein
MYLIYYLLTFYFKLNIPISKDLYKIQITQLGIMSCELRKNDTDIIL